MNCPSPVLSLCTIWVEKLLDPKTMWSFGCLSVRGELSMSHMRTALFSCGCRNVRALYVVLILGSICVPQHVASWIFCKCATNSKTPCLLPALWVTCVFASRPNTKVGGSRGSPFSAEGVGKFTSKSFVNLSTASITGTEARPLVSPWKDAKMKRPPVELFPLSVPLVLFPLSVPRRFESFESRCLVFFSKTRTANKSPGATPFLDCESINFRTSSVTSPRHSGSSTVNRFLLTSTRLFWSRLPSNCSGTST
mmetsp:Transcript_432/g.1692  ORF Transcript_432/g.1692 Transcript_432/m.1692 type:complete len:252 (-) Transcript_432:916-1671(-)